MKDIIIIFTSIFDFLKNLIMFIPNPFRNIILLYFGIFVTAFIYKKVRGEN